MRSSWAPAEKLLSHAESVTEVAPASDAAHLAAADGCNILVISDLHLGEDIKPFSRPGENQVSWLRHVVKLEHELEAFLEHHTTQRLDGRPWRLVINGDMVDFLSVCLFPREDELDASEEERRFGYGFHAAAAVRKLRSVAERHHGVFQRLAAFLAAGNELHIVLGNHDVEFYWERVQDAFRDLLVARIDPQLVDRPEERAVYDAVIQFHPWFYYQEGLCYIEHGHQYDEYCSFDYVLNPAEAQGDNLILSIGSAGSRYVCNLLPEIDPHGQEDWHWTEYFRAGLRNGLRGAMRLAASYVFMLWQLFNAWRLLRQRVVDSVRRSQHLERLRALAHRYRLSEEALLALDGLRKPTVIRSLARLLNTFFLDRFAVAVLCLTILSSVLAWAPGAYWKAAGVLATLLAFRVVDRILAQQRMLDSETQMKAVPQLIRRIIRAPYIVFGHSHDPGAHALDDGGWYFNTGTWVPAGRPGLLNAFTHLMIRHDAGGPRAELRQWRDGASALYQPPHVTKPA